MQKLNRWLIVLVIATAVAASSCTSAAVGSALYPDVDPGPDVDYIGEAVSITRAELDGAATNEETAGQGDTSATEVAE